MLINLNIGDVMNVNDMLDYFEIKLDSKDKKRVSELSVLREEAELKDNVSKVANIDDELSKIYECVSK
jgi:hypothetical protein